ncbi:haloalkane dehalogenase [Paraburkholderia sp. Ac-20347]|uniref:haloalkane dehalogenase n=1 Tax=Paraburkholderia sp. Ac-20347 TaxID=2703892 RepID=UPI001981B5AE|nr:haloalkane dehalogenase [Paraburkholderia sp. Ac-20347]MBN3810960.1 haloalkane dehalogenase [Paraburkholderia sp. Ac-20347]
MTIPFDIDLHKQNVLDSYMSYRESGDPSAPVVLFFHGNPTSSYIWRHILPLVAPVAHCIAPDLIGFGQSGKPNIAYRFFDHIQYIESFIDELGIDSAYLVAQDWGTALAFELAARRPDFVRGLAFMEFTWPMPDWAEFHADARELFQAFRTPGVGETLILEQNAFIEQVLPGATVRTLSDEEMAVYRAPFPTAASRLPIWRFPNELPIAGEPADVYATLENAHRALAQSRYPKLLFTATPGALVSPNVAARFAQQLQHCRVVPLGEGIHYLQEDHPETIGNTVREWLIELGINAQSVQNTHS